MKTLILFLILSINTFASEFSDCSIGSKIELLPINMAERVSTIYNAVYSISKSLNVDHCLTLSIVMTESTFKENAVSKKGARGLMQVMPKTHKEVIKKMSSEFNYLFTMNLNSNLSFDEIENLIVGTYYLKHLNSKFSTKAHVIMAYNMGPKWVNKKLNKNVVIGNNNHYLNKVNKHLVASNF